MLFKKGVAHFEMIMAFVFFIGFVTFLLILIPSYNTTPLSETVVTNLYSSFEEKAFTNLTTFFLKANNSGGGCFRIDLSNFGFKYPLTETIVRKVDGTMITGTNIKNGIWYMDAPLPIFYYISMSPDFQDQDAFPFIPGDCSDPSGGYTLGSVVEREVISYNSLTNLSINYSSNYESLKDELNIPSVFDFGIISEELSEINMEEDIPESSEVFARDYLVEVLYSNGTIINSKFTFKVWQ